ncbi:DNA-binding transcriptional regulator, AcrR family [Nocardiopsis flavescens]|uniref:DNA-binding transcriptional regulator, AcrR family n=1 Tax=Nocardiopsis flavescens TaxID=758803 RepID=A0A1M6PX10_9ACTN|nr:TetR/AcrR family transcriptional regulator [Nocardiopsis flavescens]SHK12442.1 DNA-binding transcriptional regulator, AcrR family [Nocardiopsis flavescens]
MARLTRVQQQARNRARVLAAAAEEFAERGFHDAKIDRIAARADLTRGAVYSNFPGKRALYFSVLADAAERAAPPGGPGVREPGPAAVLGAFARARLSRVPLTGADDPLGTAAGLTTEVLSDAPVRRLFAQLARVEAVLLALALEALAGDGRRRVRQAQAVLTVLRGAEHTAAAAPGTVDPFTVIRTCEHLAGLDLEDAAPPHLDHVGPAARADGPWAPPEGTDPATGERVDLGADGVVALLGPGRLEAVEDAARAAADTDAVTAVLVTDDPAEHGPLLRAVLADLHRHLAAAFPVRALPRARLVVDADGAVAAAAGAAVAEDTEAAVRVAGGRVLARAAGRGAAHAVAAARAAARP